MKRDYLPVESLLTWAKLNNITVKGVTFKKVQSDGIDKGSAIVATEKSLGGSSADATSDYLIRVPSDMVLSQQLVENHAKADRHLREVMEAAGELGRTARGAILIFLIMQLTHSSKEFLGKPKIGVSHPWAEYIKYMPPSVLLPTLYYHEEVELLEGTSLRPAVEAKKNYLEKEFEHLRQSTENIPWCEERWWGESGKLDIDDWKYVDALYRSRVVDLPRSGHAMVPCVDMANHASDDTVKALYEEDAEGNALLQLREGQLLHPGDEVTISYGSEKPAPEMLFSYGFLPQGKKDAGQVFLELSIPDDDPLRNYKASFCKDPPGVTFFLIPPTEGRTTFWDSSFVWWACVNEEDGLKIAMLQNNDGGRELKVTWKGKEVKDSGDLKALLEAEPLWDVYYLRAVALILARVNLQFFYLKQMQDVSAEISQNADMRAVFRPGVLSATSKLRNLEEKLLGPCMKDLEKERDKYLASETVTGYLSRRHGEDFS
ncbi:hypothetical protein BJX96DRAFT_179694 [Aspergillus floccosus]